MSAQNFSIEVRGAGELLSHSCPWDTECDAPECTVELPRDGEILLNLASVGKITIEGGLQLDMTRSQAGLRVFTWNTTARSEGTDGDTATLTVAHPNDDYPDVEISVTRGEEAVLSVEEDTPPAVLDKSNLLGLLNAYGGYIVSGLAVIGTLIFALAMPAHRNELISGAGAIGLWSYFQTDEGDSYALRTLLFIAAGVVMCFAMAMPGNTDQLIEGAGVLSALAIFSGGRW